MKLLINWELSMDNAQGRDMVFAYTIPYEFPDERVKVELDMDDDVTEVSATRLLKFPFVQEQSKQPMDKREVGLCEREKQWSLGKK